MLPKSGTYVSCGVGGAVRLIPSLSAPVGGLCTQGLMTCACFIMVSTDKRRISLMHIDTLVRTESLVAEYRWVSEECGLARVSCIPGLLCGFEPAHLLRQTIISDCRSALDKEDIPVQIEVCQPSWQGYVTRNGAIHALHSTPFDLGTLLQRLYWMCMLITYCLTYSCGWVCVGWMLLSALTFSLLVSGLAWSSFWLVMAPHWSFYPKPREVPMAVERYERSILNLFSSPDRLKPLDLQFDGVQFTLAHNDGKHGGVTARPSDV